MDLKKMELDGFSDEYLQDRFYGDGERPQEGHGGKKLPGGLFSTLYAGDLSSGPKWGKARIATDNRPQSAGELCR
jgi:hypothetical protein